MTGVYLIVEYYREGNMVFAELLDATMDDEFVYTDSFKVKVSDTSAGENARVIVTDDTIGTSDSRFITNE